MYLHKKKRLLILCNVFKLQGGVHRVGKQEKLLRVGERLLECGKGLLALEVFMLGAGKLFVKAGKVLLR